MLRRLVVASVFLGFILPFCFAADPRRSATLSTKQKEAITGKVIPAHRLGNPEALVQALSPILTRLSDAQVAEADRLLAEQDVPTIGELLADARLSLVQQGKANNLPRPKGYELIVTLSVLRDRIGLALADQDAHEVMSDPLRRPKELKGYKEILWDVHVLNNRLSNARRMAAYAGSIRRGARFNPKSLDDAKREVINTDYAGIMTDIDRRRVELEEREVELRIQRIDDAAAVLIRDYSRMTDLSEEADRADATGRRVRRLTPSSSTRFLAAYVIGVDSEFVKLFFDDREQAMNTTFVRSSLYDPDLPDKVQEIAQRASGAAGDLVDKMQLLYVGMHWWFRGRYGAGPNAWGLIKSKQALKSENAQFPLFMPVTTPAPTDPTDQHVRQVPRVGRRHHYLWAAEYRPLFSRSSSSTSTYKETESAAGDVEATQTTHMTNFY